MLGAGSWGTALSILLYNNGHEVILWSALGEEITTLREKREHVSKLPGVKIPEPIDITIDLERSLRDTDVAILAVPSPYTRSTCKRMAPFVKNGQKIVNVAKGVEEKTLLTLSEIIEQDGPEGFKAVENRVNASIQVENTVIATGGSVVYCDEAMQHLKSAGGVVYLKISLKLLSKRLGNLKDRGVVLKEGQTLESLYEERTVLYEKYADIIVDEEDKDLEGSLQIVLDALKRGEK